MFVWPMIKEEVKREVKEAAREGVVEGILSIREVLVEAMREAVKEGVEGIREDLRGVREDIRGMRKDIKDLPEKIISGLRDRLYGDRAVRWGRMALSTRMESGGYRMVHLLEGGTIEAIEDLEDDDRSIDEILVYEKDGERVSLFIVGKHALGSEDPNRLLKRMDHALGKVSTMWSKANFGRIIPAFVLFVREDEDKVEEYLRSIEGWSREKDLDVLVVLPNGRVVSV